MTQSNCLSACASTLGCNHFAWTPSNNDYGTCWMKSGEISKLNAVYNGNLKMICGILPGI